MTHNQDLEVVHKGQVAGEDEGQAVGHQGEGREARNHPSVDQEAGHQTIGPEKEHQEKGLIAVPGHPDRVQSRGNHVQNPHREGGHALDHGTLNQESVQEAGQVQDQNQVFTQDADQDPKSHILGPPGDDTVQGPQRENDIVLEIVMTPLRRKTGKILKILIEM